MHRAISKQELFDGGYMGYLEIAANLMSWLAS
jgi:hypothetical protein